MQYRNINAFDIYTKYMEQMINFGGTHSTCNAFGLPGLVWQIALTCQYRYCTNRQQRRARASI